VLGGQQGRVTGLITMLALGLAVGTGARAEPAVEERPNIVLILADDLGWGDVGFNGRTEWATPNLDRLAKRGTVFRRAYTAAVVCAPSRAALLTGKDSIHNGARGNEDDLPASEVTIAEALGARGYKTALFGKWHRGQARPGSGGPVHPLDQGFQDFFGFTDAVHAWEKFPTTLWEGRKRSNVSGYADDLFTDRAVDFLKRQKDGTFFLYVPYTATHFNIEAPDDEISLHHGRFAETDPKQPVRATYAALVTRLDRNVGRLLDTLAERHLERNTLIVFTSDHGATFESGNLGTSAFHDSNRPFRGQKRTLWEGGLRVPLVVAWDGRIAAGTVRDEPVRLTDLFPTFVAAAGVPPESSGNVDGINLLPALTQAVAVPDRTLFWEWKSEGGDQLAALRGRHKLVVTGGGKPELYDVTTDAAERRDVAAQHPELVGRLRRELDAWLATEVKR
jgi:arylsulfatase A